MADILLKLRYFEAPDFAADGKLRVAFSSETPVLRVGDGVDHEKGKQYLEVLDHDPANADVTLLNQRGAFLDEHKFKDQIGVIENAEICSDKMGRADITFCSDDHSKNRSTQLRSKQRPHISFGYVQTRCLSETQGADGIPVKRFAFQAYEISSVAVPADINVGVGRSAVDSPEKVIAENIDKLTNEQKKRMKILLNTDGADGNGAAAIATAVEAATVKTRNDVTAAIKLRVKNISAAADKLIADHGAKNDGKLRGALQTMATEAINNDEEVGAFQVRAMQEVIKASPAKPVLMADFASPDEVSRYSLMRAVQAAVKHRSAGKEALPDGLELETHVEYMKRLNGAEGGAPAGWEPAGFQVPPDCQLRSATMPRGKTRDMQATIFNAGGAFVPTNLITPIIELLRNMMVLDKAGVRTMAGLTGNIVIPRQEAAATAYSVSEIGALTASQQILGQIAMTPKRVGATQKYSKQFIMQSSPDAEAFMRDDLFKVIALLWDYLGLAGQGATSQPLGIINTPGVGSVTFGATPTYIKLVSFETIIRTANVIDPITYMSTPTVKGVLKTVAEALTGATTIGGSQNAIWKGGEADGMVNGYQALASNQISNNLVIAGAFNQLIMGLWGGLDVVVDYVTAAANAEVVLTINTWGDYVVRHPQAFVVSSDAGNQ